MSQALDEDEIEQYRSTAGAESKFADISGDGHDLKEVVGNSEESKSFVYDPEVAGQRFVDFYDDPAASIREYFSNAETACIRRARAELEHAGHDAPSAVDELLEAAREKTGYDPVIEVSYNRKSDATRLVIEDNGIGISIKEFEVLRRIGYSASHMQGEQLGQFGLGFMSGFLLTGTDGVFKLITNVYPHETDERGDANYALQATITNFEFMDDRKDGYGTRFEFPNFSGEAKNINIPDKVEEYAEGMRVDVVYRDYDKNGQESSLSEEYVPRNIENDYADESMVLTYENEYFKAVMSPDDPETRRDTVTYNVTMPIRRNYDAASYRSDYGKFNAPWQWDFRGKREDGPIVHCPSQPSIEGKVPVPDSKYGRLPDERQADSVPSSEVPKDAIKMPAPSSSRDSYKSGHDDFWKYVSSKLDEKWKEVALETLQNIDSFDTFRDAEPDEKQMQIRAFKKLAPSGARRKPDEAAEDLEKKGIDWSEDLVEKFGYLTKDVLFVPEYARDPTKKSHTGLKPVWEVVHEASTTGGDVRMAKTVNERRANIAWELGDVVVRLENFGYDHWETLLGWKKLKDLPLRNLAEELPQLDDDAVERLEKPDTSSDSTSNDSTTNTPSYDYDREGAKQRNVKVRTSTSRGMSSIYRGEDIFEKLDGDGSVKSREYLVVFDATEDWTVNSAARQVDTHVAAFAIVPQYVYKYLTDADRVFESMEEIVERQQDHELTLSDGTTEPIGSLTKTDLLVYVPNDTCRDVLTGREDELLDHDVLKKHFDIRGGNASILKRAAVFTKDEKDKYSAVDVDAQEVVLDKNDMTGLYTSLELGTDVDRDAMLFKRLFVDSQWRSDINYHNFGDDIIEAVELAKGNKTLV